MPVKKTEKQADDDADDLYMDAGTIARRASQSDTSMPPAEMPFGKHKGKPWPLVPVNYLRWLLTIDTFPGTRAAVLAELARRGIRVRPAPSGGHTSDRRGPGRPDKRERKHDEDRTR